MSATLTPPPFSLLAAFGSGAPGAGRSRPRPRASDRAADDSNPALMPVARLVDFHCVLIMPAGPARDALAMALWDVGMIVTTFQGVHEAEGVLVGEAVQCVLVDATLGGALGPHLVWWLNAVGRGAVKVVLFGALSTEQQREALDGGVAHCLGAPVQRAAFARALGNAMGFAPVGWRRAR